jgi:hypothetical protein
LNGVETTWSTSINYEEVKRLQMAKLQTCMLEMGSYKLSKKCEFVFLLLPHQCNGVHLNSHVGQVALTLVANDNEFWMIEKINEIHLHPLTGHIHIAVYN